MSGKMTKLAALTVALLLLSSMAMADSWSFSLTGTAGGQAETGVVKITTVASGFEVDVYNGIVDPQSIAQVITNLQFNLASGVTASSLGMTSGNNLTQAGGTVRMLTGSGPYSYTDTKYSEGSGSLGSALTSPPKIDWGAITDSAGFQLCPGYVDTNSSCALKPEGIIGPAGNGNVYNGSPSLVNGTHTPELYGSSSSMVMFHVYAKNVTAQSTLSNIFASTNALTVTYGTTPGNTISYSPPNGGGGGGSIPEPASLLLFGTGILELGRRIRNRRK